MNGLIVRMKKNSKEGFTLIELICVVALLGILAAVAVPAYAEMQVTSAKRVAMANARTNYSIGRANDAVKRLDPSAATEEYLGELGTNSWNGETAIWKGKINGDDYSETFGGK